MIIIKNKLYSYHERYHIYFKHKLNFDLLVFWFEKILYKEGVKASYFPTSIDLYNYTIKR